MIRISACMEDFTGIKYTLKVLIECFGQDGSINQSLKSMTMLKCRDINYFEKAQKFNNSTYTKQVDYRIQKACVYCMLN